MHWLLSTTSSCFSCHHAAHTRPRWRPGPSSRAYLSLHSLEASQGIELSRSLFTCTNANQAATCTCNTRPGVSPHQVVNHSSQPGVTIHRSSDAPVLTAAREVAQAAARDKVVTARAFVHLLETLALTSTSARS
jgi:hypothetical protein